MVYTFTPSELNQISIAFSAASQNPDAMKGKYRPVYDLIYDILTDESGFDSPVEGLETSVWIWVGGARQVNSGEGFSAHFIREYTRTQHEQRYGLPLTENDLNSASNAIAENFITDVLQGSTPTLQELGLIDAAPIAGSIFNKVFSSNFSAWSGTILFPFLGIDTYYKDWLLNNNTVSNFKPLAGTYDLISSAAAAIPLAQNPFAVVLNLIDNFGFGGLLTAASTTSKLSTATDTFYKTIYQIDDYNFALQAGNDLFGFGGKSATYIVGTLGNDVYSKDETANRAVNGTSGKDVIQAGLGNDHVFGGDGDDLIDGDVGNDIIDGGLGNDLIKGGSGDDKFIVGEGNDVILDGETGDRLYVRTSVFGGEPVNDEDHLIPLLGGLSGLIRLQSFTGEPLEDLTLYTDMNENGTNEYWFSSEFLSTIAVPGGGQDIEVGSDVFNRYNLDPFAIVYEMNGADLEISIFQESHMLPVFGGSSFGLNFFDLENGIDAKVTLVDFEDGDFGISFTQPLLLGTETIDDIPNVDAGAFNTYNSFIAQITNNGNLNETLGKLTPKGPLFDPDTGEPLQIVIKTGGQDDTFQGDETDEVIDAQGGNDTVDGQGGDDIIEGGTGDDTLTGGTGDDTISGGPGDDTLIGGQGADAYSGDSGTDTISYAGSSSGVTVNLLTSQAMGGDAQGDTIEDVEGIIGSNFDDNLTGSNLADILYGESGDDSLSGNDGDDTLGGGAGADVIDGGAGLDVVSYRDSTQGVTIDLITQQASGGEAQGDLISNVEGAIGSDLADTFIGNDLDNIFSANAGDDVITAAGGNDRLEGGAGADSLSGGVGNDTVVYTSSNVGVTIDLSQNLASGGHATGDQISGFENITGSNFGDQLTGDAATNTINAGDGDDVITVTSGGDTIIGGFGNDTLTFINAAQAITLNLANNTFSGGIADGLSALSIENISGSAFNDQITGSDFANTLTGGAGDDTFIGAGQDDIINGGDGTNDTAIYSGNQADYDITQFTNGALRIEDIRADSVDGTDTIVNIEFIQFNDTTVALGGLNISNVSPDLTDDQGFSVLEDDGITIQSATLLANDQDFDGDTLTITNVLNAQNGEVELLANGDIEFYPDEEFFGTTYFDYEVSDGISAPSIARVTIEVTPEDDAPIALNDNNLTIYTGAPTLLLQQRILANDQDTDGEPLTITSVSAIAGGTASLTQEGDVLFTPTGNAQDYAAFSYTLTDPTGLTATATVQTTLQERLAYDAIDDQFQTIENQPLIITRSQIFSNDINEDSQDPIILGLGSAPNGTATINIAGDILFTPTADFFGTTTFTYQVTNGEGGQDTANITVVVTQDTSNTAPVASDDQGLTGVQDTPATIAASTLLANDTDGDNDTLTIVQVGGAVNGTAALTAQGDVLFTPTANYTGPASFTYTIDDGNGGQATATATLTVNTVNLVQDVAGQTQFLTGTAGADAFVIDANSIDYNWDETTDGTGIVVYSGADFDILTDFEQIRFNNGIVEQAPDGSFSFTANATAVVLFQDDPNQNEYLTGTPSTDGFVIDANSADYGWGETTDGLGIVVYSGASFDVLTDFEQIHFNDGIVEQASDGSFSFTATDPNGINVITDNLTQDENIIGTDRPDRFSISGVSADYGWGETTDSSGIVVWNDNNFDVLTTIEQIAFDDGVVTQRADNSFVFASNAEILALAGDANNNTLTGGNANDTLSGMGGDDTLSGGAGLDIFIASQNNGNDTISDFENGLDLIDLSNASLAINEISDLTISQTGTDTLVSFSNGSFSLQNVQSDTLTFNDFIFS